MLPRDPSVHRNLGILLSRAGASDDAEEELRQSLDLDPRNATSHQELGRLFARETRTPEAEREYLAALQLAPSASLYYELGSFTATTASCSAPAENFVLPSVLIRAMPAIMKRWGPHYCERMTFPLRKLNCVTLSNWTLRGGSPPGFGCRSAKEGTIR